jgi:glutathione S-transferase
MVTVANPKSHLPSKLSGFHFFGFDAAPCSQRVSFALAEKGLVRARAVPTFSDAPRDRVAPPGTYIFRPVSLVKHENLTEEYAAIHPDMVVPALVHDGTLHLESMDIVAYVDTALPGGKLIPEDAARRALCDELVELGKSLHVAVRHVTFLWSLGKIGKIDARTLAALRRLERSDSPEQLGEFYARFNNNAISKATFVEHLNALETGYAEQNARLRSDGRPFLTGDTFTIADIIWAIKVLRLTECAYPFERNFPELAAWYARVSDRPGFRQGVMANHRFFHTVFRVKSKLEGLFGRRLVENSRYAGAAL